MSYADSWKKHFRYDSFRPGQEEAIHRAALELDAGRKFIVAELPTGIGKSDMAMALAQVNRAFVVTSQNILIDQYVRDFGHLPMSVFYNVRGKKHYKCSTGWDNCEIGDKSKCEFFRAKVEHPEESECGYKRDRNRAARAQVAMLNTTYYAVGTRTDVWEPRPLAVIDEAHNLANEVMGLTEFVISERNLHKLRITKTIPNFPQEDPKFKTSVSTKHFIAYCDELLDELQYAIEHKDVIGLMEDEVEKTIDLKVRIERFLRTVSKGVEWVVDREEYAKGRDTKIVARPLSSAAFAQELLFCQADQFVLQSATIVDAKRYIEELGIETGTGQAFFIRKPSPFPIESRLVYAMNTAKMGYKEIDGNLPKIAQTVEDILRAKKGRKGIIHTSSYKIQKYLKENIRNSRLIFPETGDRHLAIEEHFSRKDDSVLVSPSMTEGLDGKGDLVRFQIICKIPYPSLQDRRISILANRDWGWYNYQTLKTMIQSIGRGTRSPDDWCENYVLDSGFESFINRSKPGGDFLQTIRSKDDGLKTLR